METIIGMVLEAGQKGVDLSLYTILPIMVIMLGIMKVLDEKNILSLLAKGAAPVLLIFGLPGIGVFAIIQILFVSFAAPVATLKLMENNAAISDARIAATLAAILVMAQANAVFPLAAVGLNVPVNILTSLVTGLAASFIAFKLCEKKGWNYTDVESKEDFKKKRSPEKIIPLLFKGGEEGVNIVIKSIPPLIIAIFMVTVFEAIGVIKILEDLVSPALVYVGIPGIAVLPIVTKFIAGGTAMMAILLDLVREGAMSVSELNRVAGFTLNPLDPVGLAVLMATGPRVVRVVKPAIFAAAIGILLRAIIHILIF